VYVGYDNNAFPYPQTIGKTAPSISGLGPADENMLKTIFIMPNKGTDPDATLMIVVDEVTPETDPKTYQYVYVGNINNLPSDVLTESSIVNDLSTGGTDKPLSAEQGRTLNSHVNYTTCGSGASDQVKLISDDGFELSTHLRLLVLMTNTNTNSTPKFNINGTGAKDVWYNGNVASDTNTWSAREVLDVYYDGINYVATTYGGAQFSTGEKVGDVGIDDEPTAGSENLVKSGGIYAIQAQVEGGYLYTLQFNSSSYNDKTIELTEGKYHILVNNTWSYAQNVSFKDANDIVVASIQNVPVGEHEYDVELSNDITKIRFAYGVIKVGYKGLTSDIETLKTSVQDLNNDVNGELLEDITWPDNQIRNKDCVLQPGHYKILITNTLSSDINSSLKNSNGENLYASLVPSNSSVIDTFTLSEASAYIRFAGTNSNVKIYTASISSQLVDESKRIDGLNTELNGEVLKDIDTTIAASTYYDFSLANVQGGDVLSVKVTGLTSTLGLYCYVTGSALKGLGTIRDTYPHLCRIPNDLLNTSFRLGNFSSSAQTVHISIAKQVGDSVEALFGSIEETNNAINDPSIERVFKTCLYQQYASGILSDLNNAKPNTKYFLQLGSTNRPAHLPSDYSDKTDLAILETFSYTAYTGVEMKQQIIKPISIRQGYFHIRYWHSIYGWNAWQLRTEKAIFDVGAGRQYTTLRSAVEDAVKVRNAEVYIHAGTYDLCTEFATELADSSYNQSFGLFLKNGIRLHFLAGSYVKANVDMSGGDDVRVLNWFSPFEIHGDFEIDGLNIEVQNTRYCVHDDTDGLEVKGIYRNCVMVNHTISSSQYAHGQCIGGGIVTHKDITIDGCVFSASKAGDPNIPAVFYHNGNTVNDDSKIFVRNCRFADNNQLGVYSRGQSQIMSYMYACGNSLSNAEDIFAVRQSGQPYDNMDVIAWNNEFRDSL
jgi:hypothetical protein